MPIEPLAPGAVLNERYEVKEVVGRGGMGTVYRARDTRLDSDVAIKELIDADSAETDRTAAIRQFEREARLLAQLAHPNLPRVSDYFVEHGHCFLVMEFVDGQTLEARLKRMPAATTLPLAQVLDWALSLCEVLVYLHEQTPPIVFRDMKPANVMITSAGHILLIDFGIARQFNTGATRDTLLYGSPGYSPPEQYGRTQTDPRSDIYALGATLHHLVTGRDPSATPFKYPSIRTINPGLPQPLDVLITRCVEMDVDRRYQTARELRDNLKAIRDSIALQQSSKRIADGNVATPEAVAALPAATRPVWVYLVPALCILLLAGAFALYRRNQRETPLKGVANAPISQPGTGKTGDGAADAPGGIKLTSTPDHSTVYVDGQSQGTTPLTLEPVPAGSHQIRVTPPPDAHGVAEWTTTVDVRPGNTVVVQASLPPAPGDEPKVMSAAVSISGVTVTQAPEPGVQPDHMGVLIHLLFTLVGGRQGAQGTVTAAFLAADGQTPLKRKDTGAALTQSATFPVTVESGDKDITLFIPGELFPVSYNQATWRLQIFIDGSAVYSSDVGPLVRAQ